jgi:hypothetical protein
MIAPLAKLMDWSVLQIVGAILPRSANERDLKLEQAVQFLNGPNVVPAESQPAQLDFMPDASGGRFRFPTPRPSEFAENNLPPTTTRSNRAKRNTPFAQFESVFRPE